MAKSHNTQLTALWSLDPARARRYVISVLEATSGNVTVAAKKLNISHRTMARWVADNPDIKAALERIRLK